MPTSFNDLPTETKLEIIHWAHALDSMRMDYVAESESLIQKRGNRVNALFQVNRELSEMTAAKMFETVRVERCTVDYPIFASSILPRYGHHFRALRFIISDGVDYVFPTIEASTTASNKIATFDVINATESHRTDVLLRATDYLKGVVGEFEHGVTRLSLSWLDLEDTAAIAQLFPNVRHLTLRGQCLWGVSDDAEMEILTGLVSSMSLDSLEFDPIDRDFNCREFHDAWLAQDWTHRIELSTLSVRVANVTPTDWKFISRFAPNLAILSFVFTADDRYDLDFDDFPITSFPLLHSLTLIGTGPGVLFILDALSSSPLKHITLVLDDRPPSLACAPLILSSLLQYLRTLRMLDCSLIYDPLISSFAKRRWIGDEEATALMALCKEGTAQFTSNGVKMEEYQAARELEGRREREATFEVAGWDDVGEMDGSSCRVASRHME